MSGCKLFSESEPDYNPLSPYSEMRTSSGLDIESENEGGGRRRLTTAEIIAEAFAKKKRLNRSTTNADILAEKRPCQQATPSRANKHTRLDDDRSKNHSSSCHRPSVVSPGSSPTSVGVDDEVKSTLKEITSLLNIVVKRVENVEDELRRQKTTSPSSSSDSTPARAKPPLVVKSEVRRVYRDLLESDDRSFTGFNLDSGSVFNSPANKAVVSRLVTEVRTFNPSYQASTIKAAVYTYYRSLSQENRLKLSGKHKERKQARRRRERLLRVRRSVYTYYRSLSQENRLKLSGKHKERKQARRRRERLLRKLQERQATLNKSSMPQKDKDKWGKVLVAETMSSEESDEENEEVITVKPLPWRAEKVSGFFHRLDGKVEQSKSNQAKRQRKQRVEGSDYSLRSRPVGSSIPDWAFVASN